MKAIFTTKIGSGYDDLVEERYHFPSTYLSQVRNALNDTILYYEPRRRLNAADGRQAYFAMARVVNVEPDPNLADHYYARLIDYLDFDQAVPFKLANHYFESALERTGGETNKGAFGRSVRNIPDHEFEAIVAAGFTSPMSADFAESQVERLELDEAQSDFKRPIIEMTSTKLFRDRAFARHIQMAYDKTCAVTGMQIINGGGRPEAQAAHIRPVASDGSDSVRNGLALSGTIHWMFDRGLISIDSDYRILFAGSGVPPSIRSLANPTGHLRLPKDKYAWPHQRYLNFHREFIFKG